MPDIVISEFMDEATLRSAFAGRDVLYDPKLVESESALFAALRSARALVVRNRTQVRTALLAAAPKLVVVGRLGVGLDNIDMTACKARGVAVYPATGANNIAVAEYVITAMLVLLRRAWFATPQVIAGHWPRMTTIGRELSGKTIGLIGFGAIARETAQRARALGMQVVAFDPYIPANSPVWNGTRAVTMSELLRASDVVSLHVPLTTSTHHMIDAAALAQMPRHATLINAARGGVVDEEALASALKNGQIAGAALDVFEKEPLDGAGGSVFADAPNLILTPHIAGVTEESNVRVSEVTAEAVLRHLAD